MGEIPPSTIFTSGLTLRMARAPAIASSANIFQSGSILKSQCDRLFGSFHSITASTMFSPAEVLQRARQLKIENVLPIPLHAPGFADPGLCLRVRHDFQPRAAQHRLGRGYVRNPPVRRIVSVLVLDEVHRWKIKVLENLFIPEVIVLLPLPRRFRAADHGLEQQFPPNLLHYLVEGKQGITQVIEHAHEQNEVELPWHSVHVIHRALLKLDLQVQGLGREARLVQVPVIDVDAHDSRRAPPFHFQLTLGKSARKCRGAVFTPNRLMLWNHSPSSSMRWARATRSTSAVLFCPASAMINGSPAFCRGEIG